VSRDAYLTQTGKVRLHVLGKNQSRANWQERRSRRGGYGCLNGTGRRLVSDGLRRGHTKRDAVGVDGRRRLGLLNRWRLRRTTPATGREQRCHRRCGPNPCRPLHEHATTAARRTCRPAAGTFDSSGRRDQRGRDVRRTSLVDVGRVKGSEVALSYQGIRRSRHLALVVRATGIER